MRIIPLTVGVFCCLLATYSIFINTSNQASRIIREFSSSPTHQDLENRLKVLEAQCSHSSADSSDFLQTLRSIGIGVQQIQDNVSSDKPDENISLNSISHAIDSAVLSLEQSLVAKMDLLESALGGGNVPDQADQAVAAAGDLASVKAEIMSEISSLKDDLRVQGASLGAVLEIVQALQSTVATNADRAAAPQGHGGVEGYHIHDPSDSPSRIFIVAAGHSGTSALSNLLDTFGVSHGPPEGPSRNAFWERDDLVAMNDHMLNPHGVYWNTERVTSLDITTQELALFRAEASELLYAMDEECYDDQGQSKCSWVLKDPRTCLTFRWWRCLVEELDPIILYIVRHPMGVVAKNYVGYEYWSTRQLAAIASTWGIKRLFLPYEDLLRDPEGFANSVYSSLQELGIKHIHAPSEEYLETLRKPSSRAWETLEKIDQLTESEKNGAMLLYDKINKNRGLLALADDTAFMQLLSPSELETYQLFRPQESDCEFVS